MSVNIISDDYVNGILNDRFNHKQWIWIIENQSKPHHDCTCKVQGIIFNLSSVQDR